MSQRMAPMTAPTTMFLIRSSKVKLLLSRVKQLKVV